MPDNKLGWAWSLKIIVSYFGLPYRLAFIDEPELGLIIMKSIIDLLYIYIYIKLRINIKYSKIIYNI